MSRLQASPLPRRSCDLVPIESNVNRLLVAGVGSSPHMCAAMLHTMSCEVDLSCMDWTSNVND